MLKIFYILLLGTIAPSLHNESDNPFVSGFNFMEQEIWANIPNTNGEYQLSNFGRIRSWVKSGTKRKKRLEPLILKTPQSKTGYLYVCINFIELNKVKTVRIHQWVARLFISNPNKYPYVLHKDDIKTNCHYTNLEWGDHEKNMKDAFTRGVIIPAKGVARKKSSLTESDVRDIFKSKEICMVLAKKYNVNHTCISDIRSGRSWNHITGLPCTRKIKPKYSKDILFKS